MSKEEKTIEQLKFIASMFRMAMKEFDNVIGPESIQAIFRLIGERQGETVEKRMREKFNIEKWTPEEFADKFIKDVLEPALGKEKSEITINGNQLFVKIKVCPFKRAGIDISDKYYCTYTEGVIDYAAKNAFGSTELITEDLISEGNQCCQYKIKIKTD
ncbi:MAG: methanogen output domain 1-containing protein [Candidatus Lokiarchaeota archaeon]